MKLLYQLGALCSFGSMLIFWKALPWWGIAAAAGVGAGCAYQAWIRRTPRTGAASAADAPGYDSFDTLDVGDAADIAESVDAGSFDD